MIAELSLLATIFLSQNQFYPLREPPRGYLGRFSDLPLEIRPELAPDPDQTGIDAHPYWGSFYSQEDFEIAQRYAKSYGIDGFSYFPAPYFERQRYYTCGERSSVTNFLHTPIGCLWRACERDAKLVTEGLRHDRIMRLNGKKVVISYWTEKSNTPEQLAAKLAEIRKISQEDFLYVVDMSSVADGGWEFRRTGALSPKGIVQIKERLRAYLRACDGVGIGDTFSFFKMEKDIRIFHTEHYAAVAQIMKEVVSEPEFKGRKILGLSALISHENPCSQNFSPVQDGTRTLRNSLAVATSVNPDFIVLPEWDEFNENTCIAPTLANGFSTKRIVRYFTAQAKGLALTPIEGDDTTIPDLTVSYRKQVSPGEKFFIEVLNVPDGTSSEPITCRVTLTDETNKPLKMFDTFVLASDKLEDRHLFVPSEELALQARAVRVCLEWQRGEARGRVFNGLHPVDILPAVSWNVKEVKQPIRDLAKIERASVDWIDGKLKVDLACAEPIRHVMVVSDGLIQYVAGGACDANRFREDETHAVFKLDYSAFRTAKNYLVQTTVENAPSAEWFDWRGVTKGAVVKNDMLSEQSESEYLRILKSEVEKATIKVDLQKHLQGTIRLSEVYQYGASSLNGTFCTQCVVSRLRTQSRFPLPLKEKTCSFDMAITKDRPSVVALVQLVTMSGKTWRSKPIILSDGTQDRVSVCVGSAEQGKMTNLALPGACVPRLVYDFAPVAGGFVPTKDGYRHFCAMIGGAVGKAVGYCSSSGNEGTEPYFGQLKPEDLMCEPQRVQGEDGAWALSFDGVDDLLCFPQETIPEFSGWRMSFDLKPARNDAQEALFIARNLWRLTLDHGELICTYDSVAGLSETFSNPAGKTGLKLAPGVWHHVEIVHRGEVMEVSVDGKAAAPIPSRLPGTHMSPLSFGHPRRSNQKLAFYRGELKNLVIDHALKR